MKTASIQVPMNTNKTKVARWHSSTFLPLLMLFFSSTAPAVTVQELLPGAGEVQQNSNGSKARLAADTITAEPMRELSLSDKEIARDHLERLRILPPNNGDKVAAYILYVLAPIVLLMATLAICRKA